MLLFRHLFAIVMVLLFGMMVSVGTVSAEETLSLEINEDTEIEILKIGAPSSQAVIWFACNQGAETAEYQTARKMASLGYQFYFPDMLSAHFLSPTPSNIARVPTDEVVLVIEHILKQTTAEQVILVGGARAAVPVIKGLAEPSVKAHKDKIKGAVLITPRINQKSPEPGAEPVYISEVGRSSHPIVVLEGERTPNRWGLPLLKTRLSRSGSTVATDLIKGVRGYFYLREEKTPAEEAAMEHFDQLIHEQIQKLGTTS